MHKFFRGYRKAKARRGFTLIELAIVLAVTSLMTAGLWRMMASGNTQLRDQAAADKQRELTSSIRNYLASAEGDAFVRSAPLVDGSTLAMTIPTAGAPACGAPNPGLCNFLSPDFVNNPQNAYGQDYAVQVRRQVDGGGNLTSYSFMILTRGGETIPDTSGGRISSMIGNDGGFVYSTNVCGANPMACGAYGTWAVNPVGVYGFGAAPSGRIASRTFVGLSSELNTPWLARLPMLNPDTNADMVGDFNTLSSPIALNNNILYGRLGPGVVAAPGAVYGGQLLNIERITLGRDGHTGPAPLSIANSGCFKNNLTDNNCDYIAQFIGDVTVTGLLMAKNLYASQFVYDGTTSDRNMKTDIIQLPDILSKMSDIHGYSFRMKEEPDRKRYGVIAQEVEKYFPELIVGEKINGYKSVDYVGLIGPLVESVNALKKENDALKAKLDEQGEAIRKLQEKGKAK